MKIPEQSLFGSYASNLCHLYFCSHVQSRPHLGVLGLLQAVIHILNPQQYWKYLHISWWIACSNSLLFRIARTFPLLLLAQYGVTISTLDWHTSSLGITISVLGKVGSLRLTFHLSPPHLDCQESQPGASVSLRKSHFQQQNFFLLESHLLLSTHQMSLQEHPVETWHIIHKINEESGFPKAEADKMN